MRDTPEIHLYPEIDVSDMKETCGIHARYMQDTCSIHVSYKVIKIHTGYIRDTHSEYMQDTYLWGYGECILCVMYLRVKIQCILNVF
jgi:hypothetical protein